MARVTACDVPEGSLLATFGGEDDYRDCFCGEVAGVVSLPEFIERFYSSMAFLPERMVLRLMGRNASGADIRALARRESDRFGVWEVVSREAEQILLHSKGTGTASWLAVSSSSVAIGQTETSSSSTAIGQTKTPAEHGTSTTLYFGSWVGRLEESGWRMMKLPHQAYSRMLLGGC